MSSGLVKRQNLLRLLALASVVLFAVNLSALTSSLVLMLLVVSVYQIMITQKIFLPNLWLLRYGLLILGVAVVLSILKNGVGERTLNFLVSISLKIEFLLILVLIIRTLEDVKLLIRIFVIGVMFGLATAIYEFIDFMLQGGGLISLAGIYGNRNTMVGLTLPACLFSFFYVDVEEKKAMRFASIAFLISYLVLLLSQGRAALGLASVGVVVIYWYSSKVSPVKYRFKWWLGILVIISVVVAVVAYDNLFITYLVNRYLNVGEEGFGNYGDEMRKALLKTGMDLFQNNALLGIGPEEFKKYGADGVYKEMGDLVQEGTVSDQVNMHNTYLSVFTELGVIGGVGFLMVVMSGLCAGYIAFKYCSNQLEYHWVFGLGVIYSLYAFYMFTGHFLYDYPFWFLLALMLALPRVMKGQVDCRKCKPLGMTV